MGNISKSLEKYSIGLRQAPDESIKYVKNNTIRIMELLKEVRRNLLKELKQERNINFSSQDLRSFVVSLEGVHKTLNKKISYTEIEKRLVKKYKERKRKGESGSAIDYNMVVQECNDTFQLLSIANDVQHLLGWFNHYALVARLIEQEHEYDKFALRDTLAELTQDLLRE